MKKSGKENKEVVVLSKGSRVNSAKTKSIASSKLPYFAEQSLMKQIVANKAAYKAAQSESHVKKTAPALRVNF